MTEPPIEKPTGKIVCQIDNALTHSIKLHIEKNYPDEWTLERYQQEFPGAPLLSELAKERLAQRRRESAAALKNSGPDASASDADIETRSMREVFGLEDVPAVKSKRGQPIQISVLRNHSEDALALVPDIDTRYVFDIPLIKTVLMALEMRMPVYLWGLHGTGKTTCLEQVCARSKRPFLRVQHTINTEEAHILGQYLVKTGEHGSYTEFNLGPLPLAMLHGYVYCADEYDIATPAVISVYQSVLEGKPLVIKDAPPEHRVIRPHPNFRFVATGNTNGIGDETGLYQGTQIQNAASYSRFAVVEEVQYMAPQLEAVVIANQARIQPKDAADLVRFANNIRETFKAGKLSMTISPRELINAARLAVLRGSDWIGGLRLAFINRLSRVDQEAASQHAQRIFGNG